MTEIKTCCYQNWRIKKPCGRELYDDKHCLFHSKKRIEKKDEFMREFNKLIEKKEEHLVGFVFPEETNLSGADLKGANLREANLFGTVLSGANLKGANLAGANLIYTDLSKANLQEAVLEGANLQGTTLEGADLSNADLSAAALVGADLTEAKLTGASLLYAILSNASLERADLSGAKLEGTDLKKANLDNSVFKNTEAIGIKFNKSTRTYRIDTNQIIGSPRFVRFVKDQQYLIDYKESRPFLYFSWWLFADCGRSFLRWAFWSFLFVFGFAYKFILTYGENPQAFIFASQPESWITFFYYSVATFAALGFGDVVPAAEPLKLWVMLEVALGYFMLGGLISIMVNKLALRS